MIHSDFNNVAKNHQLTYEEVESMVMSVAQNIMPINVEKLQKLGIDEISLVRSLKGSKYILLKSEKKLSNQQKEKLKKVKEASPLVEIMHSLKEEFSDIFEKSSNLGEGTLKLIDWLKKAEPYYKKSVKTIKRWFGEIVGYFEEHTTSAVVEGINNKLKVLKRSGFGFRNFNNFEIRALLLWHFPTNLAH